MLLLSNLQRTERRGEFFDHVSPNFENLQRMQVAEFRGERDDCIGLNTERVQRRQAAEPGTKAPYLRS
jgi:hypothetical protein